MQDEIVSKTRRKKQMHELQALGEALVGLPQAQLETIDLPADLADAVREARRIRSHEARRRQMQYIGRLMRSIDPHPIRARLDAIVGHSAQAAARHRRLEAWRERLLADDGALTEYAAEHPGADLQKLRAFIRSVRNDREAGRTPRAYRELFRLLNDIESAPPLQG